MNFMVLLILLLKAAGASPFSLYFERRAHTLTQAEIARLDSELLSQEKNMVLLKGYTSPEGDEFTNTIIRFLRCAEVRDLLLQRGFKYGDIEIYELALECNDCTEKTGRRVDLHFSSRP